MLPNGLKRIFQVNNEMQALISALRSGKYEQSKHMLYDGYKYSFAGLMCEISEIGQWREIKYNYWVYQVEDSDWKYLVPDQIARKFNLDIYEVNKISRCLKFKDIANYLEEFKS